MSNLQNVTILRLISPAVTYGQASAVTTSTPKSGMEAVGGARPKHTNPSPNMVELNKTIEELTIQNNELEWELLGKKNALLLKLKKQSNSRMINGPYCLSYCRRIRVITNYRTPQSYKGKVKTHNYNRVM